MLHVATFFLVFWDAGLDVAIAFALSRASVGVAPRQEGILIVVEVRFAVVPAVAAKLVDFAVDCIFAVTEAVARN